MANKAYRTLAMLGAIVASPLCLAAVIPPELTTRDVNTLVALEATSNALLLTAFHIDQTVTNQVLGSWSGTVDTGGWNLIFTGSINGVPLSINQTGMMDLPAGKATWTNSVFLASDPFAGYGTVFFDPSWTEYLFGIGVTAVQALSATTGPGVIAGVLLSPLLIIGESELEEAGAAAEALIEKRNQSTTVSSKVTVQSSTFTPPLSGISVLQSGSQDPDSGALVLQSSVVPGPGALVLLCSGAAVFVRGRRRRSTE